MKKIPTVEDHLMLTKEGREELRTRLPWYGEGGKEMIAYKALNALDFAYEKIAELEAKIPSKPATIKFKSTYDVPNDFTGVCETSIAIFHYTNGKIHRENGPAITYLNGNEKWICHGKLHNENGPAIKNKDGFKEWFYYGTSYGVNDDFNKVTWKEKIEEIELHESFRKDY